MKLTMALTSLLLFSNPGAAGELHITVSDEGSKPLWTRLEVRGPDGKMFQAPGAIRDKTAANRAGGEPYYLGSFVVNGECRVEVPPGRFTVVAEHGLEYERGEKTVDVTAQSPAEARFVLRPWIRMNQRGWWSGDMHVHRPLDDTPSLALAEDINVIVLTTMWNKRNLWEGKPFPAGGIVQASADHLITILNAEDERGGGAWMLHDLRQPLKLDVDGRWYPPGIFFVKEARAQKAPGGVLPWFDCEKPIWWEVPVMMALETPDTLGVLHNHLNQYGVFANEAWGRPRDQEKYPGREGFVQYSLGLYYRYLNLGFKLAPSAGSASGVLPAPVGYNRMYVQTPEPFSVEAWYRALKEGRSFVTNGPMLFLDTRRRGSRMRASVDVSAREPIDRVELVANGEVIHRFPSPKASRRYRGEVTVDPAKYSWIAARCFLQTASTIRLAHSAPVYLDGKWDAKADAEYFLQWIDDLIAQATSDAKRFASPDEREQVLALYRKAQAFYASKAR
jgi:hypothetical protein